MSERPSIKEIQDEIKNILDSYQKEIVIRSDGTNKLKQNSYLWRLMKKLILK